MDRKQIALNAKIELARREFFFYCQLKAPDFYKKDRLFLKELCSDLQAFIESDEDVCVVNEPPRHGKSRTGGNLVEWLLGKDTSNKIMTGSYNETLSTMFSKNVRNTIQEIKADPLKPVFSDVFPGVIIKRGDGAMKKSECTEKVKGNNRLTIQAKNYPLLDVDSIKINGSTVNESDYSFDESGIIEGTRPWSASGQSYGISNFMVQQSKNIEIAYLSGYVLPKDETEEVPRTLPYDIEAALFSMINGAMVLSDGAAGLKTFAISDVRWEWDKDYMQSILPSLLQHRAPRF